MNTTQEAENKPPWIKPTLTPHRVGWLNKFGTQQQQHYCSDIDGVPVSLLVENYGSPLFVFSEKRLRHNARALLRAFSSRYARVQYSWSYKTNYLGAICNTLHQEDAWAEVVSNFEYEKARALGVPGQKIIFNGPYKTRAALERAVNDGAHIHIDHLDELYLLENVAKDLNKNVRVGLRLNFDSGFTEPWSRFGFNVESGQAMDAAWRLKQSQYLQLSALHSHIGTFVLEPRAYGAEVKIMCQFMAHVEQETDCTIDIIDVGGGFASHNALQGIYLSPDQVVPTYDQYAEAICDPLSDATHHLDRQQRNRPLLVLETGRAVVDDSGFLVATVIANKRLPDGRRGLVIDAGVNLLFTAFWYNHDIRPVVETPGMLEETVVYGPLCMNIDVIRHSVMLPPLKVGDRVVLKPAGAYNTTQWLQFIEYRPQVALIHGDGRHSSIRGSEDLATITALERIPKHLINPNLGS